MSEPTRTGRPWLNGLLAGAAVLFLVAYPVLAAGLATVVSFQGCLIDCSERDPEPLVGIFWLAMLLVLLAIPLLVGLAAAGKLRQRPTLIALAGCVVVLTGGFLLLQDRL